MQKQFDLLNEIYSIFFSPPERFDSLIKLLFQTKFIHSLPR